MKKNEQNTADKEIDALVEKEMKALDMFCENAHESDLFVSAWRDSVLEQRGMRENVIRTPKF